MAKLFLDANDVNIHVSNAMTVYGSTGAESVLIDANTTGVVVDQNVERVDLPGTASAFTYQQAGNQLKVYSGATLVATIPLQGDADGTQVVFSNGSVQATLVGGVMTLGGATVTTTAAAVTPTTIDTTVTSGSSTGAPTTPTFSVAGAASVTEGNTATFTVTLSSAQGTASTVAFALEGTGGAVLGTDTGAATPGTTGTLTFAPGEVTKTITVPVTFDSTTETGEGLKVTLSSPSTGTALGTATASTTIADPTAPTFTLTSNVTPGSSTEEGNTVTYTITPSGVTDKAYTFTLSTIGDTLSGVATAASATDFSPASQTITFAAGTTKAQTVVQTIVNDGVTEGLEGYKTSLLNSSYAAVSSVSGTINDPITSNVGTTYTLTTSIDNVPGTNGNDIIIGDNTTATAVDQINGGSGTDTLKLYGTVNKPVISNVENIYLNAPAGDFDISTITGVTNLEVDSEAGNRDFTITTGQSIKFSNLVTANMDVDILGNTPTSLDLTVNKVGTAALTSAATPVVVDINGTALTTLNITGSTAASSFRLDNTGAAITTLNIAGDQNVSITTNAALNSIKTVNAASNTGGVTFNEAAMTADNILTFTGGSGNDVVVFKAAYLTAGTSGDVLDGGAGIDTLFINDTTPVYNAINAAKNFEVLGLGTTAATVDVAQLTSINSFAVGVGNLTETFNNAKSTSTFTINNTAANTGTVTINNAVGETSTSVTIDNQSGASKALAALAFSGVSTIALTSSGNSGAANVLTNITNADNSAITVKGSTDFSLAGLDATTTGSKVDASAFTGILTVVGSAKNDVLIGGSGADTLQGAVASTVNQADTLTGGAGADTFKFVVTGTNVQATDSATLYTLSSGTTAVVHITDFVAGTDKIHLEIDNTAGTLVAGTSMALSAPQTITTATNLTDVYAGITAIAASTNGGALSGAVVTVSSGAAAGTYLYINDATAAVSNSADMLINITGISGTLSATDFTFA